MMCESLSSTDVESNLPRKIPSGNVGFQLRWSRLVKKVQVKETSSGLLRGSIASQTGATRESFSKACPVVKTILDEVSGSAEPGEVVALMGPSGAFRLLPILPNRGHISLIFLVRKRKNQFVEYSFRTLELRRWNY